MCSNSDPFSSFWNVPRRSYFVTGTDTGVGKTWVSAALMLAHAIALKPAGYMKPVQTGCPQEAGTRIAPDVEWVRQVSGFEPPAELEESVCPYRFRLPASPHLAAAREGAHVQMDRILAAYQRLAAHYPNLIVEGAGGVWVPLNERETMLDLMRQLNLPVLVVSRPSLGTLNHTLMTVNTLREAGLEVGGIILVQTLPPPADATLAAEAAFIMQDNQQTLELWSGLPILGRLPFQECSGDRISMTKWLKQIVARS